MITKYKHPKACTALARVCWTLPMRTCPPPFPYITRQQPGHTSGHRTNMNFAHVNCDTSGEQHGGDSPHRTQRATHNRVNIHAPRISTDDNGVARNTPPVSGVWPGHTRNAIWHKLHQMLQHEMQMMTLWSTPREAETTTVCYTKLQPTNHIETRRRPGVNPQ